VLKHLNRTDRRLTELNVLKTLAKEQSLLYDKLRDLLRIYIFFKRNKSNKKNELIYEKTDFTHKSCIIDRKLARHHTKSSYHQPE